MAGVETGVVERPTAVLHADAGAAVERNDVHDAKAASSPVSCILCMEAHWIGAIAKLLVRIG